MHKQQFTPPTERRASATLGDLVALRRLIQDNEIQDNTDDLIGVLDTSDQNGLMDSANFSDLGWLDDELKSVDEEEEEEGEVCDGFDDDDDDDDDDIDYIRALQEDNDNDKKKATTTTTTTATTTTTTAANDNDNDIPKSTTSSRWASQERLPPPPSSSNNNNSHEYLSSSHRRLSLPLTVSSPSPQTPSYLKRPSSSCVLVSPASTASTALSTTSDESPNPTGILRGLDGRRQERKEQQARKRHSLVGNHASVHGNGPTQKNRLKIWRRQSGF